MRCICTLAIVFAAGSVWADAPAEPQPWQFEVVVLRNGAILKGLILDSNEKTIKFQCVQRHPDRATVSFPSVIDRAEIDRVVPLSAKLRDELKAHLQELEQSSAQGEKERMYGIELEAIPWGGKLAAAWRYNSDYFTIISNAPEEIVRRAAVRLEQIYVAYSRYLPPRHKGAMPTTVMLLTDRTEYEKLLAAQKLQILNLAFYDPAGNRIVCYSDLQQLGERLVEVRQHHRQLRTELEAKRAEFAKLYKGAELKRMVAPIDAGEAQLAKADSNNNELFAKATSQLFAMLYHESFHAYLGNFVYPPKVAEVPRWLNEGLAQIFETAIVEGSELRIGNANEARLARAKDAAAKGELVPLADLLQSGHDQFALSHMSDKQVSDRHYLTSWALAFYLTFEKRLLGSEALDHFIQQIHDHVESAKAFEELIGQPISKFEPEFRKYILYLQADGSVARVGK
jgi:hypothetical protein